MSSLHVPVLLNEVLEYVNAERTKILIDCTFGGGGHTKAILEKFPDIKVIGIDQNEDAINGAKKLIDTYRDRLMLFKKNFRDIDILLSELQLDKVDCFLLDLGVSTDLLVEEERGFSFNKEGPLDMRIDKDNLITAEQIVNSYSKEKLAEIFFKYGEEKYSRKIAKAIVEYRKKKRIETTTELANIIKNCVGFRQKIHPATKVFQALRIFVNDELGALNDFLYKSEKFLSIGGRLIVISFHSLEDRIVKNFYKEMKERGIFNILTKKPIVPLDKEIKINPRSRSAKMRVAERVQ